MAKNPNGGGATPAIKVVKVSTGHGVTNATPNYRGTRTSSGIPFPKV